MAGKGTLVAAALASILAVSGLAGCRQCGNGGCCGLLGRSPTVCPPPTYSLQIPSAAQNQPYYNGGTTTAQQPSHLVQPNGAAPMPVGNQPNSVPNEQWRAVGGNNLSLSPQPQSVLDTSTAVATPRNYYGNGGLSFTESTNYRTTSVDETRDQTRLPVTDASSVRAPSSLYSQGNGTRLAQQSQLPAATTPLGTISSPVMGNPVYASGPQIVNGYVEYYGQPMLAQPQMNYPIYGTPLVAGPMPTVLAQSTAMLDPTSVRQGGWRDRELTADSFNR
jgi:hypothetical protein